jgi:hypothetical protein
VGLDSAISASLCAPSLTGCRSPKMVNYDQVFLKTWSRANLLPLCKPILLWVVRNIQLSPDCLSCIEVHELIGGILTPIVRPQNTDFLPCLVLHKSFKLLEPTEDLSFGLHEENLRLLWEFINEYKIVYKTSQRC